MRIFIRKRNELYKVYIGNELQSKHKTKESAMVNARHWRAVAKSTGENWSIVDRTKVSL